MRCSFFTLFAVATLASTVSASPLQRRKNVDRPNPPGLEHCPGRELGDADKCTFESQETGLDTTIVELVGDPASNCQGGTTDLQLTLSGSKSVSQSFKAGVTTGFGVEGGEDLPIGISFSNSDTWSSSETKTFSQSTGITIQPGKKASSHIVVWFLFERFADSYRFFHDSQASLVAKITAKTFLGRVRVNYGDPTGEPGKNDYHFIYFNNGIGSIQPTDTVVWDQKIVNCDEDL
ncbi:hypothetical protein AAF712_010741 [Marasmius tenuissimus]|uniref:Uncharacterized protein n=1 Tax=Marasmius tenuissimus TaxID=585030 RepID=A0ABR2ZM57_9AGAR